MPCSWASRSSRSICATRAALISSSSWVAWALRSSTDWRSSSRSREAHISPDSRSDPSTFSSSDRNRVSVAVWTFSERAWNLASVVPSTFSARAWIFASVESWTLSARAWIFASVVPWTFSSSAWIFVSVVPWTFCSASAATSEGLTTGRASIAARRLARSVWTPTTARALASDASRTRASRSAVHFASSSRIALVRRALTSAASEEVGRLFASSANRLVDLALEEDIELAARRGRP